MLRVALKLALVVGAIWFAISALWAISGYFYADYQCPVGNDCQDATTTMYLGMISSGLALAVVIVSFAVARLTTRPGV